MGQCSAWLYVTVEADLSARAERQLQRLPAATGAAAVVVWCGEAITPSLPEGLAGAATASSSPRLRSRSICDVQYDVTAWPSGRPSRVMVSSAAGLIITVTDGAEGKSSNAKQGARRG
jgi:hypothetical protein